SSPSRSTRARDQAFSPVSAFVASIAPLKDIALGGDGTMLRKTFIAIATTAAIGAAVALAPAVASARGGGGGGHGGGGHSGGGYGGGGRGGGYGRGTRYGWWARLWWRLSRRDGWRRPWRDDRWRLPWCGDRRRLAQRWWVRWVPQLRIPAISCTTLQSVCGCSLQSVRSSPLRLRGGA